MMIYMPSLIKPQLWLLIMHMTSLRACKDGASQHQATLLAMHLI